MRNKSVLQRSSGSALLPDDSGSGPVPSLSLFPNNVVTPSGVAVVVFRFAVIGCCLSTPRTPLSFSQTDTSGPRASGQHLIGKASCRGNVKRGEGVVMNLLSASGHALWMAFTKFWQI